MIKRLKKYIIVGNDYDRISSFKSTNDYNGKNVISTSKRNRILKYTDDYVEVQSGISFQKLNNFLKKKNRSIQILPNYADITLGAACSVGVHGCNSGELPGIQLCYDILVIDKIDYTFRFLKKEEICKQPNVVILNMKVRHVPIKESVVYIKEISENNFKYDSKLLKIDEIYWTLWIPKNKKMYVHTGYEQNYTNRKEGYTKSIVWPLTAGNMYVSKLEFDRALYFYPSFNFLCPNNRSNLLKTLIKFHDFYGFFNFEVYIPLSEIDNTLEFLKFNRNSLKAVQIRIINKPHIRISNIQNPNKVYAFDIVVIKKNYKDIIGYFLKRNFYFHEGKLENYVNKNNIDKYILLIIGIIGVKKIL